MGYSTIFSPQQIEDFKSVPIYALIEEMRNDEAFRQRCMDDPKQVVEEMNWGLPLYAEQELIGLIKLHALFLNNLALNLTDASDSNADGIQFSDKNDNYLLQLSGEVVAKIKEGEDCRAGVLSAIKSNSTAAGPVIGISSASNLAQSIVAVLAATYAAWINTNANQLNSEEGSTLKISIAKLVLVIPVLTDSPWVAPSVLNVSVK